MCGIAGIISTAPLAQHRIRAATDALRHRGPERSGYFSNEAATVHLGHRKLSIIDLSPAADQPFLYAGRYSIVYNGELYNYIELRNILENKGFHFSSASDTEVVVASYAAYGTECLKDFDGAFAFAIWDNREEVLFAARDRFGEKPFFYATTGSELVFASEIKALWAAGVPKEVNQRMLYNFLTIGYTANPYNKEETFFDRVHKLPAASSLTYSARKQELIIEKYWQAYIDTTRQITEGTAIELFQELLTDSIKKRLRSNVPVGTSLSGGLDSSAIVAICNKQRASNYTHKCFTAGFAGFVKDETATAAQVAKNLHVTHTVVRTGVEEIVSLMEKVMRHQEEPFVSASALAQFKVYEAAKQNGVTVVLDGQGADEVLGGYHKYFSWYWSELYRHRKLATSHEMDAAKALGITIPFGKKNKVAALFPQLAFALQQSRKKKTAARSFFLDPDFAFNNKDQCYYSLPARASLNDALYFNTFDYGLEELLRIADRNSMAHGLEVRLPFLSHKLVEALFTFPPHFKIQGGWSKWLLRKTVEPLLPADIVWQKGKTGFEPPQQTWMQDTNVAAAIQAGKQILTDKGILNKRALSKKIQPHEAYAAINQDWKYWSASFLYK